MTVRPLVVLLMLGSVALSGCDGGGRSLDTPAVVGPSLPAPVAAGPARSLQPMRVAGRVLDGTNNPVAGAKLTQWDTSNTALTDGAGLFELMLMRSPDERTFWVTVEKPGHETSEQARPVDGAVNTVLRLHQIRTIEAGQTFGSSVASDDSACGYHWGYVCRRLRVTSERTGVVTAEIAVGGGVVGVIAPTAGTPPPFMPRLTAPVRAGTEVVLDIGASWDVSERAPFVLNTTFTPTP